MTDTEFGLCRAWYHRLVDLSPQEQREALAAADALTPDLKQALLALLEPPSGADALLPETGAVPALVPHPASLMAAELPGGTILCGRYRIIRGIGSGGFSRVYLAEDRRLNGRLVVVKLLPRQILHRRELLEQFQNEVSALAQLRHPNLVTILDTDSGSAFSSPALGPFLVLEFIEGPSLRQYLAQHGALPPQVVSRFLKQIANALEAAHRLHYLHLDLKPENILVEHPDLAEPRVVVIDFGIAQLYSGLLEASAESRVAGSPAYMAPEQFAGRAVPQSDVYALAVVAREMLTGARPQREGEDSQARDAEDPARRAFAGLPEHQRVAILQALSDDPAARPSIPLALVKALFPGEPASLPPQTPRNRFYRLGAVLAVLALLAIGWTVIYYGAFKRWRTESAAREIGELMEAFNHSPSRTEDTPQVRIAFLNSLIERTNALRNNGMLSVDGYELLINANFQKAMNLYHPSRIHLGRSAEAVVEFEASAALADEMAGKFPEDVRSAYYTSETRVGLGDLLIETGKLERAERVLLDGIALNRTALVRFPEEKKLLGYYAALLSSLSRITEQRRDWGSTGRLRNEMVEIGRRNYERSRDPVDYPHFVAYVGALMWRVHYFHAQGEPERALADCDLAKAILEEGLPHAPSGLERPWWMAQVDYLEGITLLGRGDPRDAEQRLEQAYEQFEQLEKLQAPNPALRRYLALTLSHLALAKRRNGRPTSEYELLQADAETRAEAAIKTDASSTEARKEAETIRENRELW